MGADRVASPPSLHGVFAALKLRLLANGLRVSRRSRLATFALAATSTLAGSLAAFSFVRDHGDGPVAWSRSLLPGFTVVFLAWVFGPLLLGGVDDALDPRRLALLPLRSRELARGLVVGGMIGFLPLGSVLALAGVVIAYARGAGVVLVPLACLCHLALAFGTSRLLAVSLAHAASSRRGRDLAVFTASVTAAVLWLATQGLGAVDETTVDRVGAALRWTPAGLSGAAVLDVAHGRLVAASARIAAGALLAGVTLSLWSHRTAALVTRPTGVRSLVRADRPVAAPVRFLARVAIRLGGPRAGSVFVKELRYLVRSPARRSALVVSTVMGVPFVVLQVLRAGGFEPGSVVYAPAALLFGLGTVNNLVGADAGSLWLEMSSGARLRELLVGRGLAAVPYLVVPSTIAALVLAALSHDAAGLAAVLVLVWSAWGVPLGVGSYLSVRAPFAQTDDDNPFSNTRAAGHSAALVLAVAAVGTVVVAAVVAPLAVLAVHLHRGPFDVVLLGLAGLAYGTVWWLVGVHLAERRVRRHGTDLVSELSARQVLT